VSFSLFNGRTEQQETYQSGTREFKKGRDREREREREREGAVLARQVLVSFGLVQWEGGRDEEEGEYENDVALASLALWP